ncbi:hypothetical protein [Streptacidiphilus cavernicola]|uniref:DUF1345 domain-containing protein n=1 Tax=Streptacidiphilus cavernicola TaxID=3342716 RepID=A0ABV6W2R7_9ACTN
MTDDQNTPPPDESAGPAGPPGPVAPGLPPGGRWTEQLRRFEPPAWRRRTRGERRWSVTLALLVAVCVQLALPVQLTISPHWLLPALELLLMASLLVADPHLRLERHTPQVRTLGLLLAGAVSVANGGSAVLLVRDLMLRGDTAVTAKGLLVAGAGVWLTNIIAFSLWYWEWDRGGPAVRAMGTRDYPDLLFPQMQQQGLAPADWEPQYPDYLYVAFTNATAFSPTDTMPLSRWAKLLMTMQSVVSLVTLALVIARAVNVLQ